MYYYYKRHFFKLVFDLEYAIWMKMHVSSKWRAQGGDHPYAEEVSHYKPNPEFLNKV